MCNGELLSDYLWCSLWLNEGACHVNNYPTLQFSQLLIKYWRNSLLEKNFCLRKSIHQYLVLNEVRLPRSLLPLLASYLHLVLTLLQFLLTWHSLIFFGLCIIISNPIQWFSMLKDSFSYNQFICYPVK